MVNRIVNAALAFGALFAVLVLAYTIRGHERFFTTPLSVAVFYGLPTTAALLTLGAFLLKPEPRATIAIALVSAAVAAYGFEFYLLVKASRAPVAADDSRTKAQVALDLRAQGIAAYPAVFPAYILKTGLDDSLTSPVTVGQREVLPLGGIAGARTVVCNEAGPYRIVDSDEMGFDNPAGSWRTASLDVAILGDSFAQGYCVPPGLDFAALIRAKHPLTLNLGMSGSGPLIELAQLREFLPEFRPKHVFWFFFEGNDYGNLTIEKRAPMLMRYLDPHFSQKLKHRTAEIDASYRAYIDARMRAAPGQRETDAGPLQTFISFVGFSSLRAAMGWYGDHGTNDYALFEKIAGEAAKSVQGWGGTLRLVYIPAESRFHSSRWRQHFDDIRRETLAIAQRHRIQTIDLVTVFERHPDPKSLYKGHFSEAGHRLTAEIILDEIDKAAARKPAAADRSS